MSFSEKMSLISVKWATSSQSKLVLHEIIFCPAAWLSKQMSADAAR